MHPSDTDSSSFTAQDRSQTRALLCCVCYRLELDRKNPSIRTSGVGSYDARRYILGMADTQVQDSETVSERKKKTVSENPWSSPAFLKGTRTQRREVTHVPSIAYILTLLRRTSVPLNKPYVKPDRNQASGPLTLVVHESSAELLEGSAVAHGAEGAVELVVGHHQVLGVPRHVDDLRGKNTRPSVDRAASSPPPNRLSH